MNINEIINQEYGTDKGFLFLIDLIRVKMPYFEINEDNLRTLIVEDMSIDQFIRTGFTGIYQEGRNRIGIFTNMDENGNPYYEDVQLSNEDLINTCLHEIIHATTTEMGPEGIVLQGINLRQDNQDSFFIALNEGITQMITDDLLEVESDAYPFLKNFARQIGCIIGKEKLIEMYSKHDCQGIISALDNAYGKEIGLTLIQEIYYFDQIQKGNMVDGGYFLGDKIQQQLIELHDMTGKVDDGFDDLIITNEKANEYVSMLPGRFESIEKLGFSTKNIDEERKK